MRTYFVAFVALFALFMSAYGDDWTTPVVQSFPDRETAEEEAGRVRPMIRSSERVQPKLAATGDVGLPDKLTMVGSLEKLQAYVVGKNSLQMNVHIHLGYDANGKWMDISVGKATPGYDSWNAFLEDTEQGSAQAMRTLNTSTNYVPGANVLATVLVTYFNDTSGTTPYSIGLWFDRPFGPRGSFSSADVRAAFNASKPDDILQGVVKVDGLQGLDIEVTLPDGRTGSFNWRSTGISLSGAWPDRPNKTTSGYIYLENWFSTGDVRRCRISVQNNFQKFTFTQYGEKLTPPVLRMRVGQLSVESVAIGADLTIEGSSDFVGWSHVLGVENVQTGTLTIPVGDEQREFFRAIAR